MTSETRAIEALVHGTPRLGSELMTASALSAALLKDGITSTLRRLAGDFAFAVPIGPDHWVMAVDRFAIQSLCWREVAGVLHVAARADALANVSPRADISIQALFEYLYFHAIPSPDTIFEGVHRVAAGHVVEWKRGEAQVLRYFEPAFEEPARADLAELEREFKLLLRQAVRRQFRGGIAACYLSGGTDSSTVAGLMAELAPGQVHGYSIGFEAEGYDEMSYARIAARRFGIRHHEHYVTPDEVRRHIPAVAAHFDQPFGNSSALPAFLCATQARGDGVERILAGDGGDELFGGNARYAKQRLFGHYQRVPAAVRHLFLEPLLLGEMARRVPLLRKAASYVQQANVPMPERLEMYNLLLRVGAAEILSPEVLARVDDARPRREQRAIWEGARACSELNRNLAFDWRYTLAESDLPKVTGSASLAGLAVGFPLLDEDLLRFSMRLPVDFKLKGGQLRWFFKRALSDFLPPEIITKPKHGFGLPYGVWTVRDEGLRAQAQDSMASLEQRGVLRAGFARMLLQHLLPEHPGYYGELVWILQMLEHWLRQARPDFRVAPAH